MARIPKPDWPQPVFDCEEQLVQHAQGVEDDDAPEFFNSCLAMLNSVAVKASPRRGEEGYGDWLDVREALDAAQDTYIAEIEGEEHDPDEFRRNPADPTGWPPRGAARGRDEGEAILRFYVEQQRGGKLENLHFDDAGHAAQDAITALLQYAWSAGHNMESMIRLAVQHAQDEIGFSDEEAEGWGH